MAGSRRTTARVAGRASSHGAGMVDTRSNLRPTPDGKPHRPRADARSEGRRAARACSGSLPPASTSARATRAPCAGHEDLGVPEAARILVDKKGTATRAAPSDRPKGSVPLLDLDGRAGLLELALEPVGLLTLDALLDRLGRLVDQRLGLLQAEARGRAYDLDDLDLLVAGARDDDVERRLLLLGLAGAVSRTAARGRGGRGDGGRRDAELLLERLDALRELEDRDGLELVDPFLSAGHLFLHGFSVGVGGGVRMRSGPLLRAAGGAGVGVAAAGVGLGLRGALGGRLRRRGGGAADQALVGHLLELAGQAADQPAERTGQAGER